MRVMGQTEKRILQKAQQLLQERGYQYLSFQDLADSVGIRKASVYHYFKTKEDLARIMIEDYCRRLETWGLEVEQKKLNARQKLHAYLSMFQEISKKGRFVCPGGSLLLDWNSFSKPLHLEMQKLMGMHRRWLISLFEQGIEEKTSRISADQISSHVILISTSLQGALQIARASKDPDMVFKSLFKHIEEISFTGRIS